MVAFLSAGSRYALPTGAGVVLTVLGLAALLGPALQRAGISPRQADRLRYSLAGTMLLAYWLLPAESLSWLGTLRPQPRSVDLFFVAGLSLVFGAILILASHLELLAEAARLVGDHLRGGALIARLALAFPTHHRVRTGLTVAMFGLVIFSMVVAAVLLTGTHRAYSDPEAMAGGFEIRVDETAGGAPPVRSLLDSAIGVRPDDFSAIGSLASAPAEAVQPGLDATLWRPVGLSLVDDEFARTVHAGFSGRAVGYDSDTAVWEALRTQPGLAIVAGPTIRSREVDPPPFPSFRLGGVYREDTTFAPTAVWIRDTRGGRAVKLTVIGVLDPRATLGNGLFTSAASVADAGVPPPTRTTTYLRVRPDVNATEKTLALNLSLGPQNLRASEIGEDVRRILGLRMLLNQLLEAFIGVGLLAGIAGLGVIGMRAVVERRREIGMLRALGLSGRAVQATFLLEASVVALLGIAVGIVLGIGLSSRLVAYIGREFPEIVFTVPWREIGLIGLFAYLASLATTAWPAWRAGRVEPAQALRYE
jgi:putative ABC transport system permease protein